MLKKYYKNFFPSQELFALFSLYENFSNLELIYQTSGGQFPRCASLNANAKDFKASVIKSCPQRIEIVNYNNAAYSERHLFGDEFKVEAKCLVFDIDIDDYDEVRICDCKSIDKKGSFCEKCWFLAAYSAKLVALILEKNYGFKKLFCVFSGRRGIHVWAVDQQCLRLSENSRNTILQNVKGLFKNCSLQSMNRQLEKTANEMVTLFFEKNSSALQSQVFRQKFLENVSKNNESCINPIKNCLLLLKNESHDIMLSKFVKRLWKENIDAMYHLRLFICTPRLDDNVTCRFYHPIKMPFCIHNKTDNVCHVLNYKTVEEFYPSKSTSISANDLIKNDESALKQFSQSLEIIKSLLP